MTTGQDPAVPDAERRMFDRNLIENGGRLAHRVIEPDPFCWFCDHTAGTRSKEHIFPQ